MTIKRASQFVLSEPDDLLALDRLAKARQEIEESLSKLPGHSGLSRGFGEELDFFSRWVESVQRDFS